MSRVQLEQSVPAFTSSADALAVTAVCHIILAKFAPMTNSAAARTVSSKPDVEPSFPPLPPELVLIILETAAQQSKYAAAALCVVSHRVRAVALPHLFNTLVLRRRHTAHALGRFLRRHPHVAAHVRSVFLRESTAADFALLVPCVRIVRLAALPGCLTALCGYGNRNRVSGYARAPLCTPRELLVLPGCVDWRDFAVDEGYTRAFFEGLTRLWLTQPAQLRALLDCADARGALRGLAYLATPLPGSPAALREVLEAFPALRALVVTLPGVHVSESGPGSEGREWYRPCAAKVWPTESATQEDGEMPCLRDGDGDGRGRVRVRVVRFPERKVEDAMLALWRGGKDNIWEAGTCLGASEVWSQGGN